MRVRRAGVRMVEQQSHQQHRHQHRHSRAEMRHPPANAKPRQIDKQNHEKQRNREARDQRVIVLNPCRARPQPIADAGRGQDSDVGHRQQRPHPEVPRAHKSRERSQRVLGPLVDAALQRPDPGTPSHHGRKRNKQEENRSQPEPDMRPALLGRDAGPSDPHYQQDLHGHQVP